MNPIPYREISIGEILEVIVTKENTIEVEWRSLFFPEYIRLTTIETRKAVDWIAPEEEY